MTFVCFQSATEREVCAVDSEHSNNLKNDSWRCLQIDRYVPRFIVVFLDVGPLQYVFPTPRMQ